MSHSGTAQESSAEQEVKAVETAAFVAAVTQGLDDLAAGREVSLEEAKVRFGLPANS